MLVNVVLLPLMGHVWVYAALPSSRMDLSPLLGRPDWVTQDAGHVGLMGRERGLLYWMTLYLSYSYFPALESVFL